MAASVAAAALLAIRSVAISDLLSYLLTIHLTALYQTDIFSRSTGAAGRPKNGSRLSPVQLAASNDRMEGSLRANRQDADCDDFGRSFRAEVAHLFRLMSAGHSDWYQPGWQAPVDQVCFSPLRSGVKRQRSHRRRSRRDYPLLAAVCLHHQRRCGIAFQSLCRWAGWSDTDLQFSSPPGGSRVQTHSRPWKDACFARRVRRRQVNGEAPSR